jgi:hypothetical protein
MCVDCVLTSPRIAQVDPGDEPLPEVVLSHHLYYQWKWKEAKMYHILGHSSDSEYVTVL